MKKLVLYFILILIGLVIFIPLLIMFFASFKSAMAIGSEFALKLPAAFDFDNYRVVLEKGKFLQGVGNGSNGEGGSFQLRVHIVRCGIQLLNNLINGPVNQRC